MAPKMSWFAVGLAGVLALGTATLHAQAPTPAPPGPAPPAGPAPHQPGPPRPGCPRPADPGPGDTSPADTGNPRRPGRVPRAAARGQRHGDRQPERAGDD